MACYTKAAMEWAMKVQEVILRAMAKKITWSARLAFPQASTSSSVKNSILLWDQRTPKIDFGNGFAHPRTGEGRRLLCAKRDHSTLQLKPGDHSILDHPDTGMRAESPEVSRCCIRVFQAADSGLLLCERDPQSVHADGLQIQ